MEFPYLMNVCLYFRDEYTVLDFIQINKKCKEVCESLKINPTFPIESFGCSRWGNEVFPSIETIQLGKYEELISLEVIEKVNFIRVNEIISLFEVVLDGSTWEYEDYDNGGCCCYDDFNFKYYFYLGSHDNKEETAEFLPKNEYSVRQCVSIGNTEVMNKLQQYELHSIKTKKLFIQNYQHFHSLQQLSFIFDPETNSSEIDGGRQVLMNLNSDLNSQIFDIIQRLPMIKRVIIISAYLFDESICSFVRRSHKIDVGIRCYSFKTENKQLYENCITNHANLFFIKPTIEMYECETLLNNWYIGCETRSISCSYTFYEYNKIQQYFNDQLYKMDLCCSLILNSNQQDNPIIDLSNDKIEYLTINVPHNFKIISFPTSLKSLSIYVIQLVVLDPFPIQFETSLIVSLHLSQINFKDEMEIRLNTNLQHLQIYYCSNITFDIIHQQLSSIYLGHSKCKIKGIKTINLSKNVFDLKDWMKYVNYSLDPNYKEYCYIC